MKRQLILLLLLPIVLLSCQPSEQVIQTAIAETLTAVPTATATTTPSPTSTPEQTFGTQALVIKLNEILSSIGTPVEVVDIRYEDGSQGKNTILTMNTRSTDENFDSFGTQAMQALKFAHMQGFTFLDGLVAIKVVEYSTRLDRDTVMILDWNDALAWFDDKISANEFFRRAVYVP